MRGARLCSHFSSYAAPTSDDDLRSNGEGNERESSQFVDWSALDRYALCPSVMDALLRTSRDPLMARPARIISHRGSVCRGPNEHVILASDIVDLSVDAHAERPSAGVISHAEQDGGFPAQFASATRPNISMSSVQASSESVQLL